MITLKYITKSKLKLDIIRRK